MKSFLGYPETSNSEVSSTLKNTFSTCRHEAFRKLLTSTPMPPFSCIFRFHVWNTWLTASHSKTFLCNSILGFWEHLPTLSIKPDECERLLKHWNFVTLAISAICWPLLQQHAKLILKKYPVLSRFDFSGISSYRRHLQKGSWRFHSYSDLIIFLLAIYVPLRGRKATLLPRRVSTARF